MPRSRSEMPMLIEMPLPIEIEIEIEVAPIEANADLDLMLMPMPIRFQRYDPRKRISAAQALEHEYFRIDPLPGRNALVPLQPGEKVVHYPARPVDTTTDFEGTTSVQPQQLSGNAVSGIVAGASMVSSRSVPRPMMIAMNRMANPGMAFNMASQAGMGGVNPGGIPMQRGNAAQAHQQQLRRKDQGMGMQPGYPQQKRRF